MDDDDLPILGAAVGSSFLRRTVSLDAGEVLAYDEADWRSALVVVVEGEVELVGRAGARGRFPSGSVLWTEGLGLLALRNPGSVAAVLVTVSRRAAASGD